MVKSNTIIAGNEMCEFTIPQIDSYATGVLHPGYVSHLERSRQQPRVGVLKEYKKGKFTLFSVQFLADMKNISNWAKGNKYLTEDLVSYMTKSGEAAEKFLIDYHKTQKISISYEEWVEKHISAYIREKLKTPLKRKPPVRTPKTDVTEKPKKPVKTKSKVKVTNKNETKPKVSKNESVSPASNLVETALQTIKKSKKN